MSLSDFRLSLRSPRPDALHGRSTVKLILPLLLCVMLGMLPVIGWGEAIVDDHSSLLPAGIYLSSFPEILQFSQKTTRETGKAESLILTTYPSTSIPSINIWARETIDTLTEELKPLLPSRWETRPRLDTGAYIYRLGQHCLSFFVLSELTWDHELRAADFVTRTYDMRTGDELTFLDFFPEESEVFTVLAEGIREQLSSAFPQREADEDTLAALTTPEAIQRASCIFGPSRLRFVYSASELYPDKCSLLFADFYLSDLRQYMKPSMTAETDISMYKKIAFTYDDGPAGISSLGVLQALRAQGQSATFFLIGQRIHHDPEVVIREHNAGMSVQGHSYTHQYNIMSADSIEEKKKLDAELTLLIGGPTTLVRAPGGYEKLYMNGGIGVPIIHWSQSAGDPGAEDADRIAQRTMHSIKPWDVLLMHDVNTLCPDYSKQIIDYATENGYLLLTVEDLFHEAGCELVPNHTYYQPFVERYFPD